MTWDRTYSHNVLMALDLLAALLLFNVAGVTISTLTYLVHEGKDAPLRLWAWQRDLLRWIGPRLGVVHRAAAMRADRGRAQFVLDVLPLT